MTFYRVDVTVLSAASAFGPPTPKGTDVYFCHGHAVVGGALVLRQARLAIGRPSDLHDTIIIPLGQMTAATCNSFESDKPL